MAERADRDPTMEEIVVALRETRRGAPPLTVIGRHPGGNWAADARGDKRLARPPSVTTDAPNGATDITDLRDQEIERLLIENARLNERVAFLLRIIGREQAAAESAVTQADRGAIGQDVRAALETELRPVLLVLLRLLEKQRAEPPEVAARQARPEPPRLATPVASRNWLATVPDSEAETPAPAKPLAAAETMTLQQNLRQRMTRALDALRH